MSSQLLNERRTSTEIAQSAFVALDWLCGAARDCFSGVAVIAIYDSTFAHRVPALAAFSVVVMVGALAIAASLGQGAIAAAFPDIAED